MTISLCSPRNCATYQARVFRTSSTTCECESQTILHHLYFTRTRAVFGSAGESVGKGVWAKAHPARSSLCGLITDNRDSSNWWRYQSLIQGHMSSRRIPLGIRIFRVVMLRAQFSASLSLRASPCTRLTTTVFSSDYVTVHKGGLSMVPLFHNPL